MAGGMPMGAPGQNVVPFPGGMAQPPMMPNPAYQQWMQQAQAWQQEKDKRQRQFMDACEYISEDAAKRYNIDIEADSTIAPDQEAEKQSRVQFLQSITPFMQAVIPAMQANPALMPLGKELIMFAVRGFSVSRQLDDAFENALDAMMQAPPQPPPPKGNTKSPQEIQTEAAIAHGEQQTDLQVEQSRAQSAQQVAGAKVQADQQKNAVEMMKLFTQQQLEQAKLQQQSQFQTADLALKQRQGALREGLAQARMSHYAASDAEGLV